MPWNETSLPKLPKFILKFNITKIIYELVINRRLILLTLKFELKKLISARRLLRRKPQFSWILKLSNVKIFEINLSYVHL